MRTRAFSVLCTIVSGFAAAAALAGCSAAAGTSSAWGPPPEHPVLTVDAVPTAEEGGLYVAQARGFFARQGLTVKIKSIAGGVAGIPDLQSGRAQLAAGNYAAFIHAQMAGEFHGKHADLRIIAAGSELQPGSEALYVMPHGKYQTLPALARAHARIGLGTANDVGDVMVGALLTQAGYSLADIKRVTPPAGFPALVTMLASGKVDAAWLPQPLGEIAEQRTGAVPLADFDEGSLQNLPFTGFFGMTRWVAANPDTVAAFLRALTQGQQLADTDRAAVEQAMRSYTHISPLVSDTMALDEYPLAMDVAELQRVADSMFEFGLTPKAKAPYQVPLMIQQEPGLTGG
jgi:NitT/TauT family transport system substrate-binding protein